MSSFDKIIEAEISKNLNVSRTYPQPRGEQKFVDLHGTEDVLKSFRPAGGDGIFKGEGSGVKVYPRKKNRFGNDEADSIKAYDKNQNKNESVVNEDTLSTADKHQHKICRDTVKNPSKGLLGGPSHKEAEETLRKKFKYNDAQIKKLKEEIIDEKKYHVFVHGKWVRTITTNKNSKDAKKEYHKEHPSDTSIDVKAESEINEVARDRLRIIPNHLVRKREKDDFIDKKWDTQEPDKFKGLLKKVRKSVSNIDVKAESEINEVARDRLKNFADSKGEMKHDDFIDKKSDRQEPDKFKELLKKVRKTVKEDFQFRNIKAAKSVKKPDDIKNPDVVDDDADKIKKQRAKDDAKAAKTNVEDNS